MNNVFGIVFLEIKLDSGNTRNAGFLKKYSFNKIENVFLNVVLSVL